MKAFNSLKSFYRPIQPSVKMGGDTIIYEEVSPHEQLQNFIYCYWQLKTPTPLEEPFLYRVVSDGCIDIFFNNKKLSESFVMGFYRKYTEFSIGMDFDYIGIRFLPSTFSVLFSIDAKSLSNQSQELNLILPSFASWLSHEIPSYQSFESILMRLNEKLKNLIVNQSFKYDERFLKALMLIFKNKGYLDVQKELDIGLSPRQLRRIFNYYIGTTPKAFCNMVRFQHILNAEPTTQSLKDDKLYYDVGFFDQAHFIKDFKQFYGVTPSHAFG